ncbi:hypothetical protein DMN91_006867 [Ooceraea biroi]|uniref:G-protein coupled receptors family 1 profile domain-containing protein n=1 Tax=Ooceraea biroi TaxID=2015173 RepID=A0A3L8DIJ3_OOCBI|nr:hypothetical protein DMN91_006867 [Ooceraea biroi]
MNRATSIIVIWLMAPRSSDAVEDATDYYPLAENDGDFEYANATNCTNDYCIPDEDYIGLMMQHIFPKFPDWVLIAMHSVVFTVGLFGNALVCMAVYRNHSMRTVTNYFIVNLAVADLLVLLICLPPSVLWDTVSVSVSVLTLTFISIDRWYAICFPLKFKSTTGRAKTAIIIIWLIALLFDIPELLVLHTVPSNSRVQTILFTQCVWSWSQESQTTFTIIKLIFLYTGPLLFMSVAYWQIVRVLWRSDIPGHNWKFRKEFKHTFRCSHSGGNYVHRRGHVMGISDPLKQRSQTCTRSMHTLSNNNNVQQSTEVIPLSAIINVPQNEKQE